jgi:hypothetical protein
MSLRAVFPSQVQMEEYIYQEMKVSTMIPKMTR